VPDAIPALIAQLMPLGVDVTVPLPLPAPETVSATGAADSSMNVAVTAGSDNGKSGGTVGVN